MQRADGAAVRVQPAQTFMFPATVISPLPRWPPALQSALACARLHTVHCVLPCLRLIGGLFPWRCTHTHTRTHVSRAATTQVVLVSATLPHEVLEMTHKFMTDPVRILVKRDELTLEVRRLPTLPTLSPKSRATAAAAALPLP